MFQLSHTTDTQLAQVASFFYLSRASYHVVTRGTKIVSLVGRVIPSAPDKVPKYQSYGLFNC